MPEPDAAAPPVYFRAGSKKLVVGNSGVVGTSGPESGSSSPP